MKLPRRDRLANSAIRRFGITVLACSTVLAGSGCIAFPRVAIVPPVRGQVVSARDQTPLPGALVEAFWSVQTMVQGHDSTRPVDSDYRFADEEGRFSFPRRVFCFVHYIGVTPLMWTSLNDVRISVYAGPLYRGTSECHTPRGEVVISKELDEMQMGCVDWPTTPRNVAMRYLSFYEGLERISNELLRKPAAARHPQYRQLLEYRDEMERKAAEWRERLEHAADEPVLDKPPPP